MSREALAEKNIRVHYYGRIGLQPEEKERKFVYEDILSSDVVDVDHLQSTAVQLGVADHLRPVVWACCVGSLPRRPAAWPYVKEQQMECFDDLSVSADYMDLAIAAPVSDRNHGVRSAPLGSPIRGEEEGKGGGAEAGRPPKGVLDPRVKKLLFIYHIRRRHLKCIREMEVVMSPELVVTATAMCRVFDLDSGAFWCMERFLSAHGSSANSGYESALMMSSPSPGSRGMREEPFFSFDQQDTLGALLRKNDYDLFSHFAVLLGTIADVTLFLRKWFLEEFVNQPLCTAPRVWDAIIGSGDSSILTHLGQAVIMHQRSKIRACTDKVSLYNTLYKIPETLNTDGLVSRAMALWMNATQLTSVSKGSAVSSCGEPEPTPLEGGISQGSGISSSRSQGAASMQPYFGQAAQTTSAYMNTMF